MTNFIFDNTISVSEICETLAQNNSFLAIADCVAYAEKVLATGKVVAFRGEQGEVLSYILYYDNQEVAYITMVWTRPGYEGRGYAKALLKKIIDGTSKDVMLEVREGNPAFFLYQKFDFHEVLRNGTNILMKLTRNRQ